MKNYDIPLPVSSEYASPDNIIRVDERSSSELHEEVYKFARYFKEELNYDSVPFCKSGSLDELYNALLFTEKALDKYISEPMPYRIYGACLFTKSESENGTYWILEWIWFHPFFRNRGNLKENWDVLEKSFGDIFISEPISPDMNHFLKKIKSSHTKW